MPKRQTAPDGFRVKSSLISGLLYGLPMGIVFAVVSGRYPLGMAVGLIAGILFGVLFSGLMSWFVRWQSVRRKVAPPDFGTEAVVTEGLANHFKGAEGVRGYLWLTNDRLHFASHQFNIQNHEWTVKVAEIAGAEAVKTIGLINNGLLIRLKTGEEERFIVFGNASWVSAIERTRDEAVC